MAAGARSSTWRAVASMAILTWTTLAFGGVYPWAYVPLLAAMFVMGLSGLWPNPHASRPPLSLALALGAVLVAIALQLWPISPQSLERFNPEADVVLRRHDLAYANGRPNNNASGDTPHPLSIDPARTRLALTFAAALFIYLIGLACSLRRADLPRLALGLTTLGVVVGVIGIIQKATWNGQIYGVWTTLEGGSPFGPFVNRNHFAGFILMIVPISLGFIIARVSRQRPTDRRAWPQRLLWLTLPDANAMVLVGFAVGFMVLTLLLSLSRSGITAMVVTLAATGWFIARRQKHRRSRQGLLAFLLMAVATGVAWVGVDALLLRFSEKGISDVAGRVPVWADAWRIAERFPLVGTGINAFGTAMLLYQTADPAHSYTEAHNDYLQLVAEGGLLICVPVAVAVVAFTLAVRRRFRDDRPNGTVYWIRAGAVTGIVAVAIQEAAEFSLQIPANSLLFATLCAVALSKSDAAQRSVRQSPSAMA